MKKLGKFYGVVCPSHPQLIGERYCRRGNCVGCHKDYLNKWRDDNRPISFGDICDKHPEIGGKRKYKMCVACTREKAYALLKKYPDRQKKYTATYNNKHKEKIKLYAKKYYEKNRERRAKKLADWKINNKERAAQAEREWKLRNWEAYIARIMNQNAMRRGLQKSQKLSALYRKEMAKFYRNTPDGHHVDHIIPIKGADVCGLHVPWNLQYLPKIENLKKGSAYQRDW